MRRSASWALLRRSLAVVGLVALLAAVSGQGAATAEASDGWRLVETRVNPDDRPTEFEVGVTPDYYESPRFDGKFDRYTVTASSITSHRRDVDRGVQNYDMTTTVSLTGPPAFLRGGEEIALHASGTATGSIRENDNPFEQFEFRADGVALDGETYFAIGLNPNYQVASASVDPTFQVPEPWSDDAELRVQAFLWNCGACFVEWVFAPDIAPATSGPTTGPTSTTPPTTAEPLDCFIEGQVRDAGARPDGTRDPDGHPLADVQVSLIDEVGGQLAVAATNRDGAYQIEIASDALPAGFDTGVDTVAVELRLVDAAHDPPRFEVLFFNRRTALDSDSFVLDDECGTDGRVERDFRLGDLPDDYDALQPDKSYWDDIGEIYDRIHRATELADLLGQPLDYGTPLFVCAYCSGVDSPIGTIVDDQAFWCGTTSNGGVCSAVPFIGLGDDVSALSDLGWPDNREYHEWGHHFLADASGNAMPRYRDDVNHAGYYANPSSTDSWTEAFAEFFSTMVAKHIDGESMPELYRLGGSPLDLERDFRPWFGRGRAEEIAIAGLLLDLEDGPDDYAKGRVRPELVVAWHDTYQDPALGSVLVGEVVNNAPRALDYSEQTMVAAEFRQGGSVVHTGWAITTPWDLQGAGARGFFALVIPPDVSWDRVDIAAVEGRPGDIGTDDDPVDLDLADLWEAIVTFHSAQPQSNGATFDVADLHEAMATAFGGRDADGNGMDDIDQVFVAHGLYADPDGDRDFHGETPGMTDHPGRGPFPDRLPRRDLEPLPGTEMTVDVGDVADAQVVVQLVPAAGDGIPLSYLATPAADGTVVVTVPPSGGAVLLGVVAPGFEPAVAGVVDVDAFRADVDERGEDAAPSFAVELVAESRGTGSRWPLLLIGGGILLLVAAAKTRFGRRGRSEST